jgi:thiol-disulfide isomerase/thioredoxin
MNSLSKRLAIVCAFVLSSAVLVVPEVRAEVRQGDRAAEMVAVKDAKGRRLKLKSYRGKVVVVTFGASWCKPCKKELPAWDKVAKAYKSKGVVFLAINIDKDQAKGKAFIAEAKLKTALAGYEPSGATVESYDPPTMPSTFVIDGRGLVRHVHAGYRAGDEKTLSGWLDKLLAK